MAENWLRAAIAYYKAKVAIYQVMVDEWLQELAEAARCEHGDNVSNCAKCTGEIME